MIALLQRVSSASVTIAGQQQAAIGHGFLVLLGIHETDALEDVAWLTKKIAGLRVFADEDGKMNRDILGVGGEALVVSQFTLHAQTKKGNRPSFIEAARPEKAIPLYETFLAELANLIGKPVSAGVFGADMQVNLVNDGPVTIILDTHQKK